MSFAKEVKKEVLKNTLKSRHCNMAFMSVLIKNYGRIVENSGQKSLVISSDNEDIIRKCFTMLKKIYNIDIGVLSKGNSFYIEISDEITIQTILQGMKMWHDNKPDIPKDGVISSLLIPKMCCKRAYLSALFLCQGQITDPAKSYHLEIVTSSEKESEQVKEVMEAFEISAGSTLRKNQHLVYIKDGTVIVEFLNVISAYVSLMKLENERIIKEIANDTNRRVNFETANLVKSINTATKQIMDIELIEERLGLDSLPDDLRQMAIVRLEHGDAPLAELGGYLTPAIGKSGVNHRLRKITKIADELRGTQNS